jgi:hypothetical protein
MTENEDVKSVACAKREAADRAVEALADLIAATLRGGDRGRFTQVHRLAFIGQQLEAAVGTRVEDHPEAAEEMGAAGPFVAPMVPNVVAGGHGVRMAQYAVGDDRMGLMRQVLLLAGPLAQALTEGQRARGRAEDARELSALGEALDRAEAGVAAHEAAGRDDEQVREDRRERDVLREVRRRVFAKVEAGVEVVEPVLAGVAHADRVP